MSSWEPLYATLKDVEFDIFQLQNHYKECISNAVPKNYREGDEGYDCLAITSRDGHIYDGISRQSIHENKDILGTSRMAILPTQICYGYAEKLMHQLKEMGLDCYRMRYMRLKSKNYIMPFHRDRVSEDGAWRLHIPVFTNKNCFFQWKTQKSKVLQIHIPSDGRAHLVRVDIPHRALNNTSPQFSDDRVHFICDIYTPPSLDRISINVVGLTEFSNKEKSKVNLLTASFCGENKAEVLNANTIDKLSASGTKLSGLALKNFANDSFSMNKNHNTKFHGFGFSKLPLIALALQQIKNGDLEPSESVLFFKENENSKTYNIGNRGKRTVSVLELINRIIHAQSTDSSLVLAQHLFGDIDNYIAAAFELFVKADISNPTCLQISSNKLKTNLITPWEALNLMVFMFAECPEFFDYAKSSNYKFMGRLFQSTNRIFDNDSYKCVFKVKTKNLMYFNGAFLREEEDGSPSRIRVELHVNQPSITN